MSGSARADSPGRNRSSTGGDTSPVGYPLPSMLQSTYEASPRALMPEGFTGCLGRVMR